MNLTAHTPSEYFAQSCIEACSLCHQACLQTAMKQSFENDAKLELFNHFRLLLSCAEICQTSANFQLSNSSFQHRVCEVCAEICEACAAGCEKMGGMELCVETCRACAESCLAMANSHH